MRLRLSATVMAAPSRVAADGWGLPSRVRGDTSVTSQHNASPSGVAPYTTRSRRRRSAGSTSRADVRANHCCGTTWPSGPTASRAMRTHACSRGFAFFFFRTRLFASARYKRSLCNQTYALPGGGGQGGASAPPRGARAALARARHQGRRREATQAGRQRKRAVRRLRGAPTSALPRQ